MKDEDRSYRGLFFVSAAALFLVALWAVFDEAVTRRPWKEHQRQYISLGGDTSPIGIRQLTVPALGTNDRCATCHAGIDDDEVPDGAPRVLQPHPRLDELLRTHPIDRFGCTACHRGNGLALTEAGAHAGHESTWPDPMMRGDFMQSACLSCHADDDGVEGAPLLSRGKRLFEELGCSACHSVGDSAPRRRGPSLVHVADKMRPGALLSWIREPTERRRAARMPQFWPGADKDPQMAKRRARESLAIAAYLLASSKPLANVAAARAPLVGDEAERGLWLFDRVGCRGCHALGDERDAAVAISDEADPAATDDDEGGAWGTGDDAFGFDDEAAGDGADAGPRSTPHDDAAPLNQGPDLKAIGARVTYPFLYAWLTNPREYWLHAKMPRLRLDDMEVHTLASWLVRQGADDALPTPDELTPPLDDGLVGAGRKLIEQYACFACHDIPGFLDEGRTGPDLSDFARKDEHEMYFGRVEVPRGGDRWKHYTEIKLKTPRAYETEEIAQVMPDVRLSDDETRALLVFLRGLRDLPVDRDYVHRSPAPPELRLARTIVEERNCRGCHTLGGDEGGIHRYYESKHLTPPTLDGEGARVRPQWLFDFLLAPRTQRPWLTLRMPDFGFSDEQAGALVMWLTHEAGQPWPLRSMTMTTLTPEREALGAEMFRALKCVTCHTVGGGTSTEDLAPDLSLAKARLDPRWVRRFLEDPGALLPGTRMPQFFPGGQTPLPTLLGGDVDAQMDLLVEHLMSLQQPSP